MTQPSHDRRQAPQAPEAPADTALHLASWRARALDTLLRVQAVVAALSMIVLTGPVLEVSPALAAFGWALVVGVVAVTVARRIPYLVRAWVYVMGGLGVFVVATLLFGLRIVPVANGLVAVVFAVLLLGPGAGILTAIVLLFSLATLAGAPEELLGQGILRLPRHHQLEAVVTAVALFPLLVQVIAGATLVLRGVEQAFRESLAATEAGRSRVRGQAEGPERGR